ncbi:Proteins containing armadillo/beta-catenin-like repeat [Handroanthus impetiginosus]|uniref:Proteins containing armadillo/beta-catenin-like repeat n=1 Tax=Handroanthus impetiginosus TaxID=429701 RepID=A0A2G9G6C8_9LAMI|nr:Proteins containing armadillo/beta-catenin-like repeat [Handroanthus impetiginosus]
MPASAASNHPSRPEDLIGRLNSSHTSCEAKLKALRDLKNQIIGNRTKKLAFLKLAAAPSVVGILSSSAAAAAQGSGGDNREFHESVLIQSAAVIGSFACGLDAGVKAVLDAGAFPLLLSLISHLNEKVADACARSLKIIYQSKLAPKYDFLQKKSMEFVLSLLNSDNENVTGLGASIITHSCKTTMEQLTLSEAGVMKRLVGLLGGSLAQRDASLEALAAVIKDNPEVASSFIGPENGRELNVVTELLNDKYPRTRLLACMCLINVKNTSISYLQDRGIKNKLVLILLELLDDIGQVGDEAPFVLSNLITEKEDMQKLAFDANVVEKLCKHLQKVSFQAKCLQGIFIALADLCSKLECCRDRVINLTVINSVAGALAHDSAEVRAAACIFLKNVSRSVKNLSAGHFMNETVIVPLVRLLCDSCASVQIAALGAISNVVVDFAAYKPLFIQCGGVKGLVQLSKSMESSIRVNAVWALRNLAFLVNNRCKEEILLELSISTLASLISDPEASVQEQALALIRNLVDGTMNSIEYLFGEDGLLLHAVGRQLRNTSKPEVLIQGLYTLSNVASGNEHHKVAVMSQLCPQAGDNTETILVKFLQNSSRQLRTAAVWTIINLTLPSNPGASGRLTELRNMGVISRLKDMVNDPCLDVKLRTRMALGQLLMLGDAST